MGEEKNKTVVVKGHLHEFRDSLIYEIEEGFVFKEISSFQKELNEKIYNKEYYQYEQLANDLMAKYYEYYRQIKEIDYEYVLRGAVLKCTHGNKEIRLDALRDHGVYFRNQPVMTCSDCKLEENIFRFGACGNDKYRPTYSKDAPSPSKLEYDRYGVLRHVCLPALLREWGYGPDIARSTKSGDIYIEEPNTDALQTELLLNPKSDSEERFFRTLFKKDNLLCIYGGVITIEENPEPTVTQEDLELENPEVEKQGNDLGYEFEYDWMKEIPGKERYVTEDALRKVVEISNEIQINPDDLMAVMAFESWLNPHEQIGKNGACGLIQFTQRAIDQINKDNGTKYTKEIIKEMDMVEQLDVVRLYFEPHIGKMKDLGDVYVAVLGAGRLGEEDIYSKTDSANNYENNKGLDINNDGTITKAEAAQKVIDRRDGYFCYDED